MLSQLPLKLVFYRVVLILDRYLVEVLKGYLLISEMILKQWYNLFLI